VKVGSEMKTRVQVQGFTLIEILTVIAIIAILAAILVPVAGKAKETAMKRRAATEMQGIKVATMQFYNDHRYMPWPGDPKVGADMWTSAANQEAVMLLLTGDNAMQKVYLQIPEKSRPEDKSMIFNDPWGNAYRVGMDRNMDGAVLVSGAPDSSWNGVTIVEKVLVTSPGLPGKDEPLKTFDIP